MLCYRYSVVESVKNSTSTKVKMRMENLAGVYLPTFELERDASISLIFFLNTFYN